VSLCESGNTLAGKGKYIAAREKYQAALDLIPYPRYDRAESVWVYTAIGDVSYLAGDNAEAQKCLQEAMKCRDGLGNPFILLRLGESFYDTGDLIKARDYLFQAYIIEGKDIFSDEDEKYYACIEDIL